MPRARIAVRAFKSGSRLQTSFARGSSTRISNQLGGIQRLDPQRFAKTRHRHGCSSRLCREVHADPIFILLDGQRTGEGLKGDRFFPGNTTVSQSTNAAASVAWPHNSTSFSGVNHRRFQSAPSGKRNAVSECFSSAATCCIHTASAGPSGIQTPAVLPRNAEW